MSKQIKRIVVVNAHWNNRGDEAALLALLRVIRNKYSASKITILFKDGDSIKQFPNIDKVDYLCGKFNATIPDIWMCVLSRGRLAENRFLRESIKIIEKTDLIIYAPGGSVINKRFYWRKQMEYLMPFMCARFYRIPMLVAAPSVGPFDLSKSNIFMRWMMKTPKTLCVREPVSGRYLKQIGIDQNVKVLIDLAFLGDIDMDENRKLYDDYHELKKFMGSYKKIAGVTVTDFKWHVEYGKNNDLSENTMSALFSLLNELTQEGYGILLIPQLFGNQDDSLLLKRFCGSNMLVMHNCYDADFQQYVISKLYLLIGMRYHSNIFAAKMGTPLIPIVYEEKMQGFLEQAGLNEYAVDIYECSHDKLREKLVLLVQKYDKIKQLLSENNAQWRSCAARISSCL